MRKQKKKIQILALLIFNVCLYSFIGNAQSNSELHYGVKTINTSVDNLIRLSNLSIKDFRSELEGIGYEFSGTDHSGIIMMKGSLQDVWHTSASIYVDGILIIYYKSDYRAYDKSFTDDLIDSLRPYFLENVDYGDDNCPVYGLKYDSNAYSITLCRSTKSEVIMLKRIKN